MHHPTDHTYHDDLCYPSRGTLARTRNSSMHPPWRIDPTTHRTMSERSYHGATSHIRNMSCLFIVSVCFLGFFCCFGLFCVLLLCVFFWGGGGGGGVWILLLCWVCFVWFSDYILKLNKDTNNLLNKLTIIISRSPNTGNVR